MNKLIALALISLFSFQLYAAEAQKNSRVVTTFGVLADIARNILPDKIEVKTLVENGNDPHLFQPGPRELKTLRSAQVIIANGLHFEPWLDKLYKLSKSHSKLIIASKRIAARKIFEEDAPSDDPHVWNSPKQLLLYVDEIESELSREFPSKKLHIYENAKRYKDLIRSIDTEFIKKFSSIPVTKRVVLITHDAAGYISQDYSIKSIAPIGLSTAQDFKTRDLEVLLKQIKDYELRSIFTEPSHHKILTEKLAKKANLKLGSELYLDGLSAADGPASNVEKMLRYNLGEIYKSMLK